MKKIFVNIAIAFIVVASPIINTSTANAVFGGENGKLLYGINVDSYAQYVTQNPNGSNSVNITPDITSTTASAVWSPDGNYIYYVKGGSSADFAIYMTNADGSSEVRISDYGVYGDLAVSADGIYIFFAGYECLGVLDIETGENGCVVDGPISGVAVSPDGLWVAYGRNDGVYKLNLETGSESKIAALSLPKITDWSSDGTKIAYLRYETSGRHLYFMDGNGNNITAFDIDNTHENIDIHEAVFSPDSTSLAYLNEYGNVSVVTGFTYLAPTTIVGPVDETAWLGSIDWQAIDSGIPATLPAYQPLMSVHRFYSPLIQRHLYTADENEVNYIKSHYPASVWTYEGIAFNVADTTACAPNESVHRFYSEALKSHLYTMDEYEKAQIIANYPTTVWRYEGVAYCASKQQKPDTTPVYRFYSNQLKTHLYTVDANEMQTIRATFSEDAWKYEGVAYYTYQ